MTSMDDQEIAAILPHRYPMLMVDRIVEYSDSSIVGLKNVTVNEPYFNGHFPTLKVMPGVLIIEAMAQVAGILVAQIAPHTRGKIMFLASVEEAKFRRPVTPGDQLRLEMQLLRLKSSVAKMKGTATVEGQVVAEAVLMCKLTDQTFAPPPAVPEAVPAKASAGRESAPSDQRQTSADVGADRESVALRKLSEAHKPPGAAPNKRGTAADLAASGESVVRGSSEVS